MEPGEFQGTIGRYHWESTPWWPPPRRAARGRAERRARRARRRRVRAARLLRLGPRHAGLRRARGARAALPQLPHDRAVLADPVVPAHRAQPPRERHGPHHRSRHRLPGLRRAASRRRTRSSRRCSCRTATRRGRSASGTSRPRTSSTWRRGATAGRSAAASSGSTASSAARRTSTRPRSSTTTTSSTRRRAVDDGYHLTEDLVDHAIEFVHDLRAGRRGQAVLRCTCARARATRRTRRRPSGSRATAAASTSAGTSGANRCSPARRRWACCRRTRCSRERPEWVPAWDDLTDDERRVYARYMEAFAGYLSHADHQVGRFLDALADTGDLDNTVVIVVSDNGASSEGGALGSLNDARVVERRAAHGRGGAADHRRDRRPALAQQLPVGLDGRRQHAVPPLEARGARRRCRRSADRPLAGAASRRRAGRGPRASTCTRSTSSRPCSR